MANKTILNIVETAYRATLEEQDDTIVWLSQLMKDAGAPVSVLLCGSAVAYGVSGQDASGLSLGGWRQTHPPRLAQDLSALLQRGVDVFYVAEDARERGIRGEELIEGLTAVERAKLPSLFGRYDQLCHW